MSALLDNETRSDTESARQDSPPSLTPERARALAVVAFRPVVVALVLIATATAVTLVSANSELTGLSGAIAAGWLGVHQVQLTIGSTSLGVLPLAATAGLVWMVARTCAHAVHRGSTRRDISWVIGAAVGGPLVVTIVCLAIVKDASGVIALAPPNTLAAFGWVLAVHLLGAAIGIAPEVGLPVTVELPAWAGIAAGAAARSGLRLLAAAAVVTVVSALVHWSTLTESLDSSDGFLGGLGLTLLSLLYLPNVIVGSAAVVTGSAFHIGAGSVGLLSVVGGPIPGLPVMAAVPAGPAAPWWPALLVVPAAVGVLLGRDVAQRCDDSIAAAQAAASAAAVVGIAALVLGFVAGGNLGVFGHVGPDSLLFGLLTFGWLALFGAGAAMLFGSRAVVEEDVIQDAVGWDAVGSDEAPRDDEADLPEESRNGDD